MATIDELKKISSSSDGKIPSSGKEVEEAFNENFEKVAENIDTFNTHVADKSVHIQYLGNITNFDSVRREGFFSYGDSSGTLTFPRLLIVSFQPNVGIRQYRFTVEGIITRTLPWLSENWSPWGPLTDEVDLTDIEKKLEEVASDFISHENNAGIHIQYLGNITNFDNIRRTGLFSYGDSSGTLTFPRLLISDFQLNIGIRQYRFTAEGIVTRFLPWLAAEWTGWKPIAADLTEVNKRIDDLEDKVDDLAGKVNTDITVIIGGKDMPADTSKDSLSYRNKVLSILENYNHLPDNPQFGDRFCTLSVAPIISKVGVVTILSEEISKFISFFIATGDTSELDTETIYYLQDTFFVNLTNHRNLTFENCRLIYRFNKWVLADQDDQSIAYEPDEILDFGFLHSSDRSSWIHELLPATGYSIFEYAKLENGQIGWLELKLGAGDQFRVFGTEEMEYFITKQDTLQSISADTTKSFSINDSGSFIYHETVKFFDVTMEGITEIVFTLAGQDYDHNSIIGIEIPASTLLNYDVIFENGMDRGAATLRFETIK